MYLGPMYLGHLRRISVGRAALRDWVALARRGAGLESVLAVGSRSRADGSYSRVEYLNDHNDI